MSAWELVLIAALINSDEVRIPEPASPKQVPTESRREILRPVVAEKTSVVPLLKTAWHSNFEEAQKEAKQAGLPLVVHFYADWCGPCQSREQSVLNTPEEAALR